MADSALEITAATKRYGSQLAVNDVSFSIAKGEIFGLLGPNGAGKSSLINMISGLSLMSSGSIKIFGFDNKTDFQMTRRMTGVMPQEIVIDNFFTLEQSLKMHAGYYGFSDDPVWRQTLVDRLSLTPFLKKKPLQLSGGTKRRHMLAKALIHKPKLLILDEPTAGVDVELRHNIWHFVREVNKMGTTVLLTTHYLEEAQEMCDRIGILSNGKVVALDKTQNLLNRIDDKKLIVKLEEQISAELSGLKELNAQVSPGGMEFVIPLAKGGLLGPVLDQLRSMPLRITDIQSKEADLEDVFLKLTGVENV